MKNLSVTGNSKIATQSIKLLKVVSVTHPAEITIDKAAHEPDIYLRWRDLKYYRLIAYPKNNELL